MLQYLARESQANAEPGRDVLEQQMEAKVQREKRVSGSPAPPARMMESRRQLGHAAQN